MDFLKCRLCNIKELPKKTKDRTDNTLYIYKGEPRIWKNGRLLCCHNSHYSRCKECNLEGYKKTRYYREKNKDKIRQNKKEYYEENKDKIRQNKKEYYEENKDKIRQYKKEYYEENKEYCSKKTKEYHKKNKDKIRQYHKEYYEENKEYFSKKTKEYNEKNKDKIKEYRKNYKCEHNKTPQKCMICKPNTYLVNLERRRIHRLLNRKKDKHTTEYLGCNGKELYNHLEKQFKDGMTWENKGEWHIDHIRPCASFNLELEEEIMKCFHYTNLQPLWATDNLSKSNKYDEKTHPLKWNGEKWIIK